MRTAIRFFLFFSLWIASSQVSIIARDQKYPVLAIPPELLQNADMVIRISETTLNIPSLTEITEKVHLVYTVLRESALNKASLTVYYDNDSKIVNLSGKVYDAFGTEIDRLRPNDFIDQSAVPSGTLYSDDRIRFIRPVPSKYPFTIEYDFERVSKRVMQFRQWIGVEGYHTSVEYASLIIHAEPENRPRTLTVNFPGNMEWPVIEDNSSMRWYLEKIQALVAEPLCTDIGDYIPKVNIAPAKVVIPGHPPEPASWKSYGEWINWLNQGRGVLPDNIQDKIHQLTDGFTDTIVKLQTVFRYFQENTRYISVQIGIGGYQPTDAFSVAQNGYGDCKALVNYMKALLKIAGIESHYTLVRAGNKAEVIRSDFPSLQFNHAILCIPLKNDTVWLECTNPSIPFGFLGSFTDDREALVITPDGGILTRTPAYPAENNRMNRTGLIEIDGSGHAHITLKTSVTGLQYEHFKSQLQASPEEQKKSVYEAIGRSMISITKLEYMENPGTVPEIIELLEISASDYATITGDRIFVPLNSFNKQSPLPQIESDRRFSFYPGYGFIDTDSILLRIPTGYKINFLPEAINLDATFGTYKSITSETETGILYIRFFLSNEAIFSSGDYSAYHAFRKQISKADKLKMLLEKKQP